MGYDNIREVVAVKIKTEAEYGTYEQTTVCLFLQIADSNCYVSGGCHDGQMTRRWNLIRPDKEWCVMQEVVRLSVSCEGGMLRYKGNSATKAETFISACRRAIEDAPFVDNLTNIAGGIQQHKIELPVKFNNLANYKREKYESLLANDNITHKIRYEDTMLFEFQADTNGIGEYLKHSDLGGMYAWGTSGDWDFNRLAFEAWAKPRREQKAEKIKLEVGMTVSTGTLSYTLDGQKYTIFRIVEIEGRKYFARGIGADGRESQTYLLRGFSKVALPYTRSEDQEIGGLFGGVA